MSSGRWAVVTGLVRSPSAALAKLRTLADWADQGFLDGVCISWWEGEGARHPAVSAAVRDYGFTVVETHEPRLKALGHYVHQCKSLWCGLQATPRGALVLKTRFDLHSLGPATRTRIETSDLSIGAPPGWPRPLQGRILAPWALPSSPFYIGDIAFYGIREDLLRLASFDMAPEYVFSCYMPEQFLHRAPFRGCFPLLEEYSMFMPPLVFDRPQHSLEMMSRLLASNYYLDVLACYLTLLDGFYRLGLEQERGGETPDLGGTGLESLMTGNFGGSDLRLLRGPHAVMLTGDGPVRALASGRVAMDGLGRRFAAALERVRDYGYQERFEANPLRLRPEAEALARELRGLPETCPRLSELDPATGAVRIGGHADRVAFLGGSDQVDQLRSEISELRRQLDALRGTDAAFGQTVP